MIDGEDEVATDGNDLASWTCYVDAIDDEHVHLVMAPDHDGAEQDRDEGAFPKKLLAHLYPKLGQYVTVRIGADEKIHITITEISEEARINSKARLDLLIDMLDRLKADSPEDPS